jgi:hypothetical protein
LVRKKCRTSEMFRSGRRVCAKAGAYAASVPTLISVADGVPGAASDGAVPLRTSSGDISLMIVFHLS